MNSEKFCPRCRETLPVSEFYRAAQAKDKLQGYCKPCMHEKAREWARAHPNANREYKAKAIEKRARELAEEMVAERLGQSGL